jgi:heme oxygenase
MVSAVTQTRTHTKTTQVRVLMYTITPPRLNAREYLSKDEYRFLWDANWLDNISVLWCRAVFLARLHCKDA